MHGCARSSLIAACERAGELDQALALVDSMHAAGISHSPDLYAKLIERCAQAMNPMPLPAVSHIIRPASSVLVHGFLGQHQPEPSI